MEDTAAAVVDAPASAPPSEPSSPAPSTETQSTTDRPSFGEALKVFNEAAIQQGRRPRGKTVIAPSGEVPITDATASIPATAAPVGPIPLEVHTKALANARQKVAREVEERIRNEYGNWNPQQAAQARAWYERAASNRAGFLMEVLEEALADPELSPQVLHLTDRRNSRLSVPEQIPVAEPPQPDFTDGQGNTFYSAKAQQARDEWLVNKIKADILGEVEPGLQEVNAIREERAQERLTGQIQATMTQHLTEARTWPQFRQHESAIRQALLNAPLTSGHPAEEALLLRRLYDQIVGPKLSALQQQEWIAQMRRDANASSVNPSAAAGPGGIPKNVSAKTGGTMRDALKWAATQTSGR